MLVSALTFSRGLDARSPTSVLAVPCVTKSERRVGEKVRVHRENVISYLYEEEGVCELV